MTSRLRQALSRLLPQRARATAPAESKASATQRLVALESLRQPVWAPRDYASFAREGFMQNAVVYRCVRMIAEASASVPLLLYEGANEIEEHPLLDLLARPNASQTFADLLEAHLGFLLVSGNAYLEAVAVSGRLRELHALRPDRIKVIPGADGWPEAWEYTVSGQSLRISAEPVEGVSPILHQRLFHPANDHYGLSPIEAAATAIDLHNQASRWNKALLDNAARPSGALVYTAKDGTLTPEQFARLKGELEAGFQGASNAGRPMLLEGGLDWRAMSLSPKDMDFIEAKHAAAREIALALGVPPMLLGIPGDNTYANYQEANRAFWRQTVLPLVQRTAHALANWLSPAFGDRALDLRPDLDQIEALSPERESLWTRLDKATFLTPNEKRAAAGYGPTEDADTLASKFNPHHDEQGRFTFAPGGADSGNLVLVQAPQSGQYLIDLRDHEGVSGAHAIQEHVSKSDEYLLRRVLAMQQDPTRDPNDSHISGSFPSLAAANKLVSSTLAQNAELVERVRSGQDLAASLPAIFQSPTGREAYAANSRQGPIMRDTFAVRVYIIHDPSFRGGFRIHSAYPQN